MRVLGMLAAFLTLAAAALGLMSLAGFGLTLRERVVLLAQAGLGAAAFTYLLILFGKWWARWLSQKDDRD